MNFSEELRRAGAHIWDAWLEHPFIRGLGDGTLDREKFKYWLRQDYLYLIEYARVFAYASGRARGLPLMRTFADLMNGILNTEMELHQSYAREFGIRIEDLEREEKSPTCQAYTDFLIKTAATGTVAETISALLPCFWGFLEIGEHLARTGDTSQNNPYRDWIAMYSSDAFRDLAIWSRELMDRTARDLGAAEKRRLQETFLTSSRYEYRFWEMAESLEEWGI